MEAKDLQKLIEAAKKKDNDAITALYECMHHKVYFHALMIVKNEDDALDIMQETFITAIKKLNTFKPPYNFESWIITIARNKCLNFLKKHKEILVEEEYEGIFENIPETQEFLPQEALERSDMQRTVLDAVRSRFPCRSAKRSCAIIMRTSRSLKSQRLCHVPWGRSRAG